MKFRTLTRCGFKNRIPSEILLKMKLTIALLIAAFLQVNAEGYSQQITLVQKNMQLEEVFTQIMNQTDYLFLYPSRLLNNAKPIDINLKDASLEEALKQCFNGQPLTYKIENNTVVVLVKELPPPPIKGKVTNSKGETLPGVSVFIKGTGKGTVTDANGNYSLQVSENEKILVFSFIGMKKLEVEIGSRLVIDVVMEDELMQLDQIIITGYSTKKNGELTGSLQRVSGEQLRNSVTSPNAISMLKGKTTGLYITESSADAGASGQVIGRGQSSIATATNSYYGPLYVVDGVITNYTSMQDVANVSDIEDVVVLKDAASTAIYGSRAAQGVIVINTKRGKTGKLNVNLNLQSGFSQPVRGIRFMNTTELIDFMDKQMLRYWEQTPSIRSTYPNVKDFITARRTYTESDRNTNFDWEKALYNEGGFKDISLNMNSGSEKTRFYGSTNWHKEDGIIYGNTFDRKSVRLNIDQTVSSKLTASFNLSTIIDKTVKRNGLPELYSTQPFWNPYKADGTFADSIPYLSSNNYGVPSVIYTQNFLGESNFDNTSITKIQNYLGVFKLKYEIFPGLSIQTSNSINYINTNSNSYLDRLSFSGRYGGFPYLFNKASLASGSQILPNGTLVIKDTRFGDYLTSNTISYNKTFSKHTITALAGQEWGKRTTEAMSISTYNVLTGERNLGASSYYGDAPYCAYYSSYSSSNSLPAPSGSYSERATFSVFSQTDYNYDQKYFASASLRTDATTNFGKNKRYGTFYSVSGGWKVSSEAFMQNLKKVFSNLKLRAVHGTSGRDLGDGYLNTTFYSSKGLFYESTSYPGAIISQLANTSITWETMTNTSLGIDIGLFNRINITFDFYNKKSGGLLQNVNLTSAQGSLSQYQNIGEIINNGIEILINTHNIKGKNFNWYSDFNISLNKNHISKIYQDSIRDNYSGAYYRKVGEDINVIKAIQFAGINTANGNLQSVNFDSEGRAITIDGLGVTSDLRNWQPIGSATPKFFGGITNTISYKNFTLSAEIYFQYGNKIQMSLINNFQSPTAPRGGRNNVAFTSSQHLWKGEGDTEANFPDIFSLNPNAWTALNYRSSKVWQDASHMRLRNVRFSYDLPTSLLRKIKLQKVTAYISGDNLLLLKPKAFIGADPEASALSTNTAFGGVGIGNANPRRYLLGINISF